MSAVQLEPDDRLGVDTNRDNLISVTEGLLYLAIGDDDVMLLGGEQIALRAGEPVRAWNAGDEPTQVIITGG
jgi:hypothetical protein